MDQQGVKSPPQNNRPTVSAALTSRSRTAAADDNSTIGESDNIAAASCTGGEGTATIQFSEDLVKSHETLCEITERTLDKLLSKDKYLQDIAGDISYEEVLAQVR